MITINQRKGVQVMPYSLQYIRPDQKDFSICTGFMPGKYTVKAIAWNKGTVTYESVIAVCNTKKAAKEIIEQDLKGIIYVPYTADKYYVYSGKTVIAKTYVTERKGWIGIADFVELRILQGMDRTNTIEKICRDCPEFCQEIGLKENYYPYLFAR